MDKKVIIILILVTIATAVGYLTFTKRDFTANSFPKNLEGYELVDIKEGAETKNASNVFLGIKEPIKKTFLTNYKSADSVVTIWTLIPADPSKEAEVAEEMIQNMTKQGSMFGNFNTIVTSNNTNAVTFSGPMDGMNNYIYYKDGKVFWHLIVTKGNPNEAFDIFYKKL